MTDLPVRLRQHSRLVIEVELRRLARRVPSLGSAQLDVIGEAMQALAAALIIDRLTTAPSDATPMLHRLFGPAGQDDEAGGTDPS